MNASIPVSLQVQIARLFGTTSSEATKTTRTLSEWRRTLRKLLDELYAYASSNVHTDEMHWFMVCTAFAAAAESLKDNDFWPGFCEGLIRLNFLLLGDYPDHRGRKGGKKRSYHYKLDRFRSIHYTQDPEQKVRVLHAYARFGFPELSVSPRVALANFREEHGYEASDKQFIAWYKRTHPEDYAKLF
jgi:hypothetical protein